MAASDNGTIGSGKKKRRWRKPLIILIVLVMAGGGIAYAILRMVSGPSVGTVMNNMPASNTSEKPAIELEQFDGTNISFVHPSTYTQRPDKHTGNELESYSFITSAIPNRLLTVVVSSLPSGNLESDASYYMRTLHPEKYALATQTINGDKVVIATDKDEAQQTAFWTHGGKLLLFTISSATGDAETLNQEYQQMLQSVKWR